MSNISKKHLAFIDAYFTNGFNATQAYKSVYKKVTDASAAERGSKLLRHVNVAPEVARRQAVNSANFEIKKEDLMKDLMDIKNNCKTSFPPSAIKAIEVLNKMNGFDQPTKIEHSGDMSINIGIVKPTDDDES
jgi:hypothetical protein